MLKPFRLNVTKFPLSHDEPSAVVLVRVAVGVAGTLQHSPRPLQRPSAAVDGGVDADDEAALAGLAVGVGAEAQGDVAAVGVDHGGGVGRERGGPLPAGDAPAAVRAAYGV